MIPFDLGKIVSPLGTLIGKKVTNPFQPLLVVNLLFNIFTTIVFLLYRHIGVWIPAVSLLIFTCVMYAIFAVKAPHMLSSTEIQRFGMQLSLGQKNKELPVPEIEAIPSEAPPESEFEEEE